MKLRATTVAAFAAASFLSVTASAHHEAIFGPQSSLILSAPGFVSTQAFTKNLGSSDRSSQETTFVLSAGMTPWSKVPLSFALTMPASVISEGGATRTGTENLVAGLRYRFDFESLQRRWGKDGNFVMAVGAFEPPTGNMDNRAFHGPFNYLSALITSFERGCFGTSFFTLYRREGEASNGDKDGDQLLFGGGVAYTPLDHPGRMLSFQVGTSFENHLPNIEGGETISRSGGYQWMLSPAIVGSPHPHIQLFALFSLPVLQGMRDPGEQARWRGGIGLVYLLEAEVERRSE